VVSLLADAVVITGRIEAGRILCSRRRRAGIRHLISIGARTDPPPAGYRNVTHRLQLIFEDELTAELGGPTPDDVERLIDFARRVDLSSGRLLVQCQAGISRSAAAAAIVLRVVLGSDSEAWIADYVRRVCPRARPNAQMLRFADELLGTGGALQDCW
jgi:predicted protein tyrosine phosphatase